MAERWVLVEELPRHAGLVVTLPPDEAHHLKKVLRRAQGDEVVLCDGAGRVAEGVLVAAEGGGASVELRAVREVPRPDPGSVPSVALGVLHGQAMDWAVQKAVELGVPRFVPLLCRRSQLGCAAAGRRLEHWRRVARQALKQCHRAWAMEVVAPLELAELLAQVPEASGVVAHRDGVAPGSFRLKGPALLLVGPEGGLTEEELHAVQSAGWTSLRLGEHVLRAETAVVAGTVVLSHCR